jgi:hypothetical protein
LKEYYQKLTNDAKTSVPTINLHIIYLMCFIFGAFKIVTFLSGLLFFDVPYIYLTLYLLSITAFIISTVYLYKQIKHPALFDFCLISFYFMATIVIPLISMAIRILNYFLLHANDDIIFERLSYAAPFLHILLLCFMIIVYAYVYNRKYLAFISLVIFFARMLLLTYDGNAGMSLPFILPNETTLAYHSIFDLLVVGFGHLAVGALYRKRELVEKED